MCALKTAYAIGLFFGAVATSATAAEPTRVYRCKVDEQLVFSDRPCPGATQIDTVTIAANNTYRATEPAKTTSNTAQRREPRKSTSTDSVVTDRERAKQECARLTEQMETVRAKLRTGYTLQQDRPLHDRLRRLEDRYREQKCR